jgi:hypothetical protein
VDKNQKQELSARLMMITHLGISRIVNEIYWREREKPHTNLGNAVLKCLIFEFIDSSIYF